MGGYKSGFGKKLEDLPIGETPEFDFSKIVQKTGRSNTKCLRNGVGGIRKECGKYDRCLCRPFQFG